MALPAALGRQFGVFVAVGLAAAIAHYGLLIGLVEGYGLDPVPATLVGYVAGGVVSYLLNRRLTYASARPHREATWRFATVAGTGFLITWAMVAGLVRGAGMPYLAAQLLTTAAVLFWSFGAHRLWTFRAPPP